MATLSLRINVGQSYDQIVAVNPGAAVVAKNIELNIDLTQVLNTETVILALDEMKKAFVANPVNGLITIP